MYELEPGPVPGLINEFGDSVPGRMNEFGDHPLEGGDFGLDGTDKLEPGDLDLAGAGKGGVMLRSGEPSNRTRDWDESEVRSCLKKEDYYIENKVKSSSLKNEFVQNRT